ncbi:MAG TPA: amino acid adenylation domain-containing protein, partial [Flavisolibacter sp.]
KSLLREALAQVLPGYMIPSFFVQLETLPLTPNGKVNKKALPEISGGDAIRRQYIAPGNDTERKLAMIWQEVLGVEPGTTDDFFALGGNSLLLTRVASAIRTELLVEAPMKVLFARPTISLLGSFIDTQEKLAPQPGITSQQRPSRIPLSFSQERLWLIHQIEGSSHYHIPVVLRLAGDLDKDALAYAFSEIINRHESLRTVIEKDEDGAFQRILSKDQWQLDCPDSYEGDPQALITEGLYQPFDLSRDHMLRAKLLKVAEREYLLGIVFHHIISDGWSMPIFVRELTELYKARKEKRQPVLPALSIQYADYAIWQRNQWDKGVDAEKSAYWENKLSDVKPLELPTDLPRPAARSISGNTLNFRAGKNLCDQLNNLSRQQGATLFMTLLAAYKILLYRYTGQQDICVGSPVANRGQREIEPLIGFFVNTLALRTDLSGNPSFTGLLARVRETAVEAFSHQDMPFEKVVDRVQKERDLNQTSLFQTLFVLQNNEAVASSEIGGVVFTTEPFEQKTSKFDLSFNITEEDGLNIIIQYNSDLFLPATIERMKGHYLMLLSAIAANPLQQIGHMNLLTQEEEQQLAGFNDFIVESPEGQTIIDLFEEQARQSPDAVAVVFEGRMHTYRQVSEQSSRLAHYLRKQGVEENSPVLLCLDESLDLVLTGMLGILKTGAAYVPLDPDYPQERVDYIIEDTGARFAVCNRSCGSVLANVHVRSILIEEELQAMADMPVTRPEVSITPEHLLYIIYTSGSTGLPKGVVITQGNLADYITGIFAKTDIRSNRSFGLMSTISTDLGNTVLFGSLASGGTLHVFSKDALGIPGRMHRYFSEHDVDCIKIVPSYWRSLENEGTMLLPERMIIFGGEELSPGFLKLIYGANPALKVVNHYGPTETTIGKLLHCVDPQENYRAVPIGMPFSNTQAYIVDRDLSLCPVGIPGELLIGGKGVAKGYLNKPELTREKFIDHPFDKNGKLYRTGDLARRRPDGHIEFKGRIDSQVKIRGYRVEPGEIESVLRQSSLVKQCAVLVGADAMGNNQLVAYLVPAESYDKKLVQAYLRSRLPAYMLPSMLMELDSLPLTSNGKINRKALPDPTGVSPAAGEFTAPSNETEQKLAAIWEEVLGLERISITGNFFELGGNSLIAIRLINKIERIFNVTIALREVFAHADIMSMALLVKAKQEKRHAAIPRAAVKESYELSSNQRRLWMACQDAENSIAYNISGGLLVEGPLNIVHLQEAYSLLVQRHESLRTILVQDEEGLPRQKIAETSHISFTIEYADALISDAGIAHLINSENRIAFDLYAGPLARVKVISFPGDRYLLLVTMHHIVSDGWSMEIFMKEWTHLYSLLNGSEVPVLPDLPLQYRDFAEWDQAHLRSPAFEETVNYWKNRLPGDLPVLNLPLSYARTPESSPAGEGLEFSVDDSLYDALKKLAVSHKTSLFPVLFTAFNVLLYHIGRQRQIILGTSVAGRRHESLEPLIGFFVNTLAVKTAVDPLDTFSAL